MSVLGKKKQLLLTKELYTPIFYLSIFLKNFFMVIEDFFGREIEGGLKHFCGVETNGLVLYMGHWRLMDLIYAWGIGD